MDYVVKVLQSDLTAFTEGANNAFAEDVSGNVCRRTSVQQGPAASLSMDSLLYKELDSHNFSSSTESTAVRDRKWIAQSPLALASIAFFKFSQQGHLHTGKNDRIN